MTSDILTATEAASMLRVHIDTLRKMCAQGKIPHQRLGASYRFSRAALTAWLSSPPEVEPRRVRLQARRPVVLSKAS